MKIVIGCTGIEYPDDWPPVPKSAKWFADFLRPYQRTRKPVVMEIHRDEQQSVCDAVKLLDATTKRGAWSVRYGWHPHHDLESNGWLRCRFSPPGVEDAGVLFAAEEIREADRHGRMKLSRAHPLAVEAVAQKKRCKLAQSKRHDEREKAHIKERTEFISRKAERWKHDPQARAKDRDNEIIEALRNYDPDRYGDKSDTALASIVHRALGLMK